MVKIGRTEYVTSAEAAEIVGVLPGTFRAYVHRGQAPDPDITVGRQPLYKRSTIDLWKKERPGSGARTDLRK